MSPIESAEPSQWFALGFDDDAAASWRSAGVSEPMDALKSSFIGVDPPHAMQWLDLGFGADQAIHAFRLGESVESVRERGWRGADAERAFHERFDSVMGEEISGHTPATEVGRLHQAIPVYTRYFRVVLALLLIGALVHTALPSLFGWFAENDQGNSALRYLDPVLTLVRWSLMPLGSSLIGASIVIRELRPTQG